MYVKKVQLKKFKRFDDLTIDLGDHPKKIIILVGPNGCGKSSVFDAFEAKLKAYRIYETEKPEFYSKSHFYSDDIGNDPIQDIVYDRNKSVYIETSSPIVRKSFYIRTAYRFTSELDIQTMNAIPDVFSTRDEPMSSISIDKRLEYNYKRLINDSYTSFFDGNKTGAQVKSDLIGNINTILSHILEVKISDLGNIMKGKGQLYFEKENTRNFPYANLSAGEKEVVDIIIDLITKTPDYDDTVFCIDEPELHLNTAIQRKLLIELEKLIPDTCQLWIATHSIGFLRAAQEELKGKTQILDFSKENYFTGEKIITPLVPTREDWQRIFQTALDDLSGLLSPEVIIYCEGTDLPGKYGKERGTDALVYNKIFSKEYPTALFISSGGNTELDQRSDVAVSILSKVFKNVKILVLKDRDSGSGKYISDSDRKRYLATNPPHHHMLNRWEMENYLFDKEVLKKYCQAEGLIFDEDCYNLKCLDIENENIKDKVSLIKNICGVTTSINAEIFKINLAEHITSDMVVYSELKKCIFE